MVEDDHGVRESLVELLNGAPGLRCVGSYRTAEEALQHIPQAPPDVVLMDIHLPGMNGIEALARLRGDAGTKAIPVFAFTASVMPQDRREITSAGFDGFVSKPINVKEFLETIAATMAGKKS